MNKLWLIAFLILPIIGITYATWRTWHILPLTSTYKYLVVGILLLCFLLFFSNLNIFHTDRMSMSVATACYEIGNSSLFILLYLVLLYLLLDLGHALHLVPHNFLYNSTKGSLTILAILVSVFTYGYFHYMDKTRQPLDMPTTKKLARPLKIVMASDLHLGYHNQVDELNRWVDLINQENPDLILIAGDIIDGQIRPLQEQNMAASFHRLKAPVVACLGNHEYYSGVRNSFNFYKAAGIQLLCDTAITIKGINIIGRDDKTDSRRQTVQALTTPLDMNRYTILLDHQPYHLEEAQQAGIDFQLSGHTHHGQVWPISWITDAIYEQAFGPLQKGNTQYYVSSGLGIWGGKFRIGTRSEYIVGTLHN